MYETAEQVLKQYEKRPLTALEIELRVTGKNRPSIYRELKKLVKFKEAKKIIVLVGEVKIVFYKKVKG